VCLCVRACVRAQARNILAYTGIDTAQNVTHTHTHTHTLALTLSHTHKHTHTHQRPRLASQFTVIVFPAHYLCISQAFTQMFHACMHMVDSALARMHARTRTCKYTHMQVHTHASIYPRNVYVGRVCAYTVRRFRRLHCVSAQIAKHTCMRVHA